MSLPSTVANDVRFIHFYFLLNDLPYRKFFAKLAIRQTSCQQCPNCQAQIISRAPETTTKKGYSLLRGEDYLDVEAGPIEYRDSEDFLGEGAERAEQAAEPEQSEQSEQTKQLEDGGKSRDILDV